MSNPLCEHTETVEVIVHELPVISTSEDVSACPGTTVLLTATADGALQWSDGTLGSQTSVSPTETTEYTATVVDEYGRQSTETITVNTYPIPETDILQNGEILTAPAGVQWQWYFNNEPLEGATNQVIVTMQEGYYHVVVTNEFGCSSISETVEYTVGIGDLETTSFSLWPNPAGDFAVISFATESMAPFAVGFINTLGELVLIQIGVADNSILNLQNLPGGVYVVRLLNNNDSIITRMVKQ